MVSHRRPRAVQGVLRLRRGARQAERDLTAHGFDARLGAASAFSTLGWFNDPLLPTTLSADSLTVANTVIHELTHNTYYAPGGAVFNESFANFVGSRGAERFFLARGQPAAAQQVVARWDDEKILGRFWAALYAQVDSAFKAHPGDEPERVAERIAVRDSIYAARARDAARRDRAPAPDDQPARASSASASTTRCSWRGASTSPISMRSTPCSPARAEICAAPWRSIIQAAKGDRKHPFDAVKALAGASAQR